MKTSTTLKPQRIAQNAIAEAAAAGVHRALQAREACMRELNDQEINEVSGGLALSLQAAIIAGGLLRDILASGGMKSPTTPDMGALNAGLTGMV